MGPLRAGEGPRGAGGDDHRGGDGYIAPRAAHWRRPYSEGRTRYINWLRVFTAGTPDTHGGPASDSPSGQGV